MILELQPVILAAGEGSKMYPLTENKAKCLLPIANVPMICYAINYLEKYGFVDYLVIVRSGYAKQVHQALQNFSLSTSKFEIFSIPDEDDTGTAEALVLIKDKIKSNLLVMSCDMITDSHLHRVVDIHRMYDASLTAVFANHMEVCGEKDVAAGSKSRQKDPHDGKRFSLAVYGEKWRN